MNGRDRKDKNNKPLFLGIVAQSLPISATLAINELVAKQDQKKYKLIHLGFGEALFPLHPLLKAALADAATATAYAPVRGLPEIRQAIADYLTRTRGITCSADQVVIGPGSKALLYALLRLLEGDVLLPDPSWVSYAPIARLGGKKVILVPTDASDHQNLTPQVLSQTLTEARETGADPRILIINSPGNPTGGMFAANDVKAIAQWAKKNGITLISDEIYAELAHGWRAHVSPFQFYPEGCIITGGLSKTFSAGGWRLGYAVLPATETGVKVVDAIRALGSAVWSTTATPIQKAAVVAFSPNPLITQYVQASAATFGYVTNQLYQTLQHLGVPCPRSAGGFYLYPDFAPWGSALRKRGIKTSQDLAAYLLKEWNIATLPGSAFNEDPSALRLRLSTSTLCEPEYNNTPQEREKALWKILDQAGKGQFILPFPALLLAQERLTQVIAELNKDK